MCSRPEPPPVQWMFFDPLLARIFFDATLVANAVLSQFHILLDRSSVDSLPSPASDKTVDTFKIQVSDCTFCKSGCTIGRQVLGLPLHKLGPSSHEPQPPGLSWKNGFSRPLSRRYSMTTFPTISRVKQKPTPGM